MMMFLSGSSDWLGSFFSVLALIVIFALVIVLAYFATRLVGNYQNNVLNSRSNIKVIESFRIGPNKFIAIVKIGEKYYAIGIGKDEITFIDSINSDDITDFSIEKGNQASFKEILTRLKNKKSDKE